jgi:hypothetical protein
LIFSLSRQQIYSVNQKVLFYPAFQKNVIPIKRKYKFKNIIMKVETVGIYVFKKIKPNLDPSI